MLLLAATATPPSLPQLLIPSEQLLQVRTIPSRTFLNDAPTPSDDMETAPPEGTDEAPEGSRPHRRVADDASGAPPPRPRPQLPATPFRAARSAITCAAKLLTVAC